MGSYSPEHRLRKVRTLGAEGAVLFAERSSVDDSTLPKTYARMTAISKTRELSGGTAVVFIGKSAINGDLAEVGPWIATQPCLLQLNHLARTVGLGLRVRSFLCGAPRVPSSAKKAVGVNREQPANALIRAMFNRQSRSQNPIVSCRRVDRKENAKP